MVYKQEQIDNYRLIDEIFLEILRCKIEETKSPTVDEVVGTFTNRFNKNDVEVVIYTFIAFGACILIMNKSSILTIEPTPMGVLAFKTVYEDWQSEQKGIMLCQ